MTDIESRFRIIATSGTYTANPNVELENNDILHSSITTGTHAHSFISNYQTGKLTVRHTANITAITGNVDISVAISRHGIVIADKLITVNSVGLYAVEVSINIGGLPNAPPTYLEELAKLDQYSKAQYIPNRR